MSTGANAVTAAKQPQKRKHGGQPGNTNASCPRRRNRSGIELSGHKPHQRSAKRHEALA